MQQHKNLRTAHPGLAEVQFELDAATAPTVLGIADHNLKILEAQLGCDVFVRGTTVTLVGLAGAVAQGQRVFTELQHLARRGHSVDDQTVKQTVKVVLQQVNVTSAQGGDVAIVTHRGKKVRAKTPGQQEYVAAIDQHTIVFGVGPAGTGKTYLAMAKAVEALNNRVINRIILTRPAVEAGEKLGFLPGTLTEKIDPYLRPLYDSLRDMVEAETITRMMESGIIEVAPLAYMRGRTLNDAFVILDEAQNTTPAQLKMFLTRIGFGSKMVVTGDLSQVDLPGGQRSGLAVATEILGAVDGIHVSYLGENDVVRHPVIGQIVAAYDRYDARKNLGAKADAPVGTAYTWAGKQG